MNFRMSAAVLGVFALCIAGGPASAASGCKLNRAELPVTINGMRALVDVQMNGTPEILFLDSGAFFSSITDQKAAELKLPLKPPLDYLHITGVGGDVSYQIATVKELMIGGSARRNVEFFTAGTDFAGMAGVLGENFLGGIGDVEYDFANGAIRLFRPEGCGRTMLAYWAKPDQGVSVVDTQSFSRDLLIRGNAYVNGTKISVLFDTGAYTSVLSLHAAARAGVKPGDPGVESAGINYGAGRGSHPSWIAPFASFKVGDEEIRNTHLRISDLGSMDTDMLLGFDFFLSHRVYVAKSQNKLYFTYNGGPVFDLRKNPAPASTADSAASQNPPATPGSPLAPAANAPAASAPAAASAGTAKEPEGTAEPVDAAGYARRAAILMVRHDYDHAIADFTRAIELDPTQPQYFHDRAEAYTSKQQLPLARGDLDHYLTLKPDDAGALMQRAQLHLAAREQPAAIADLEAASRAVPKEDENHFGIGQIYQRIGLLGPAIEQYDLWLASHDDDPRMPAGHLMRCRARALQGQELDKALSDCNITLRRVSGQGSVQPLETRGLVRLRRGELDKSIEDYNAALKLMPNDAAALYGRGLARLRKGATADGQADLAAARSAQPRIAAEFNKMGLTP